MDDNASVGVDDVEIAIGLIDQDGAPLLRLYEVHGPRVLALLMRDFPQHHQIAQDALGEAARKVLRAAQHLNDAPEKLGAWFYRIAHRAARDIFRRERRHFHEEWQPDIPVAPTASGESAERRPTGSARDVALVALIQQLPRLQREVAMADLASPDGKVEARLLVRDLHSTVNSILVARSKARATLRQQMIKLGFYSESGGLL